MSAIKDLFERDLSLKEFERLMREVEASPEKAMALAKNAEAAYLGLGLPSPALPKPWFKAPWFLGSAGAVMLAGGSLVLMTLHQPQAPRPEPAALTLPAPAPLRSITPEPALAPQMEMALTEGEEGRSRLQVTLRALKREPVSLVLEDASGREVKVLHQGALSKGEHRFEWDLRAKDGALVGPGVYFVRASYAQGYELRALQVDLKIQN